MTVSAALGRASPVFTMSVYQEVWETRSLRGCYSNLVDEMLGLNMTSSSEVE